MVAELFEQRGKTKTWRKEVMGSTRRCNHQKVGGIKTDLYILRFSNKYSPNFNDFQGCYSRARYIESGVHAGRGLAYSTDMEENSTGEEDDEFESEEAMTNVVFSASSRAGKFQGGKLMFGKSVHWYNSTEIVESVTNRKTALQCTFTHV